MHGASAPGTHCDRNLLDKTRARSYRGSMNNMRRRLLKALGVLAAALIYEGKRINDKIVDRLGDRLADLAERAVISPTGSLTPIVKDNSPAGESVTIRMTGISSQEAFGTPSLTAT